MTWNFLFKRLVCQGTCKWIKTLNNIWCYLSCLLSCIVPFWVSFLMKFLKLLEVYFTVCCLHSHWTFNFLCNTKEFLILTVLHKRGELNTLQESLKYSRDCKNGFLFYKEHEGQSERLAFEGFRIRKLVLSLCLVWMDIFKHCFYWENSVSSSLRLVSLEVITSPK